MKYTTNSNRTYKLDKGYAIIFEPTKQYIRTPNGGGIYFRTKNIMDMFIDAGDFDSFLTEDFDGYMREIYGDI